jgi:hypothetical protein
MAYIAFARIGRSEPARGDRWSTMYLTTPRMYRGGEEQGQILTKVSYNDPTCICLRVALKHPSFLYTFPVGNHAPNLALEDARPDY